MPVRKILHFSDPLMKQERYEEVTVEEIPDLVKDLEDTVMAHPNNLGLSLPQIGIPKQGFVIKNYSFKNGATVDVKDVYNSDEIEIALMFFFNPKVLTYTDEAVIAVEEGCLSVPDFTAKIKRFAGITLSALDEKGKERSHVLMGVPAIVAQHELDHLRGVSIIDKASKSARQMYLLKKKVAQMLKPTEKTDD